LRNGITWTYASIAVGAVIQLGVTGVTARLLDPAAFGLVAMANVLLRFGGYLAQMGVGRALIQRQALTTEDVRAGFTSSAALGLVVAVAVVASAPIAGGFFGTQEVVPVVRWLALTFLANGLGATANALLRRELRFRQAGLVEVLSYALGYGAPALLLASNGFGVWSLVAGAVGQSAVAAGLAYGLTRHPVRPLLDAVVHRRLLGFGAKVSLISFLEFIGSTLDNIVIGRFGTAAQLGLYNRALMLASLPTYQLSNGIAKVLFPVLAGGQSNLLEFRTALARATTTAIKVVLPVGLGMAVAAPELVRVVLGQQWVETIPMLRVLSVAMAANVLATFPGIALEALAVLRAKTLAQLGFVIILGTGLLLAASLGGFHLQTTVVVIAAAYVLRTIMYFGIGYAAGAYDAPALNRITRAAATSTIASGACTWSAVVSTRAVGLSDPARLVIVIAAGVVALGLLFAREIAGAVRGYFGPTTVTGQDREGL